MSEPELFPICKFEHFGERFDPKMPVAADHPMVVARPDLFASSKPSTSKSKTLTRNSKE